MHKYAAAMFEDLTLVHPSQMSTLAAPAVNYLKKAAPETNLAKRCRAMLQKV